jgi:hypothetical protein
MCKIDVRGERLGVLIALLTLATAGGCRPPHGDVGGQRGYHANLGSLENLSPPHGKSCGNNANCQGATTVPTCASAANSYCLREVGTDGPRSIGQGFCMWQVDASKPQCACIPGTLLKCADGGKRECNAGGTAWGSCS